jgi:hypothetical protein
MSVSHAARASATACGEGACGAGDCAGVWAEDGGVDVGGVGSRLSASAACAAKAVQKMNGSSDLVMLDSCLDGPNINAMIQSTPPDGLGPMNRE